MTSRTRNNLSDFTANAALCALVIVAMVLQVGLT